MTRHQEVYNEDCALYVLCSQVQLARVVVRVLVLVDVICVMHILIARVELHVVFVAISLVFSKPFFCSGDVFLYTPPSVTMNCVSCHRNDHCNFAPNSL